MRNRILSFLFCATAVVSVSKADAQVHVMNAANHNTTVVTCGQIIVDNGGISGNYTNNQNYTRTFCSADGGPIRLNLLTLAIENNYDFLRFYNGPSTASPLMATLTGNGIVNNNPAWVFTSTGTCITVNFTSDGSVTGSGWEIAIGCTPAPCNGNMPASDFCGSATSICTLDGYCGSTSGWYTVDAQYTDNYVGNSQFCGSIENNSWLSFVADAASVTIQANVTGCALNYGVQMVLFQGACGSLTRVGTNCVSPIIGNNTFTFNGLVPGNTYYLMVDGYAGDYCNYTITALSGVQTVDVVDSKGNTASGLYCSGECGTFSISSSTPPTGYSWYSVPAGVTGSGPTVNVCPTGNMTIYCDVAGACGAITTVEFQVTMQPITYTTMPGTIACNAAPLDLYAAAEVTPCIYMVVTTTAQNSPPRTVTLLENGVSYWTTNTIATTAGTQHTYTYYQLSPSAVHQLQLVGNTAASMNYSVYDCASNNLLYSGVWGANSTVTVAGVGLPTGTANWTSSCGGLTQTDWGYAQFNPAGVAGPLPTTCNVTYNWNNGNGCSGSQTQTITVTTPFNASFNYSAPGYCQGSGSQSPTITGNTGGTFSASPAGLSLNGSTGVINTNLSTPGTYNVTYSVGTSPCNAATTQTVVIHPIPTVNNPGNQTVCANSNTTLVNFTGSLGGTIYNWTNNNISIGLGAAGSGNIPSFLAVNAGSSPVTATITVTPTLNGCSGTPQNFTITVNPIPTVNAVSNQTVCAGTATTAVNFSGNNGGTTYNWSNSNPAIGLGVGGAGNIPSFTAVNAGVAPITGTITVTPVLNGCTGSPQVFTITVNPAPVFTLSSTNPTVCGASDGTITLSGLTAGANYTVSYNDGGVPVGPILLVANGSGQIVITGQNAGGYSNFVVNNGICSYTVVGPIVLSDPSGTSFTLTFTNPTTCGGTQGTITLSGLLPTTNYNLTFNDGGVTINQAILTNGAGSFTITGLDAGNYSGFSLVIAGCTVTNNGPVILTDPLPPAAPTAGTNATYCSGQAMANLTATAGSGGTLNWYSNPGLTVNIGTGGSLAPSATIGTTNYYVTETLNNCQSVASIVTVTINPTPSAPVAGTNSTYCDGDALANLTATASAGGTLNWFSDAGLTVNIGSGTTLAPSNVIGVTTYHVTETAIGCQSPSSSVTIIINPIPVFTFNASTNPTGCGAADGTITIQDLGASQNATLIVSDGSSTTSTNITSTPGGMHTLSGLSAGGYVLTIEIDGCQYTLPGAIALVDPTPPSFTLLVNNPTTCGGTDGSVTLNGLLPSTVYDITYNNGMGVVNSTVTTSASGQHVISGLGAGTYSAFTVTINNCTGTNNGPANLIDPPTPLAPSAGFTTTYCEGDAMVDLNAVASLGGDINWYSDAGLTTLLGTGTSLAPLTTVGTTTYYVTETLAACQSPASTVTITINPTPAAPVAGTDATYCDGDAMANMTAVASVGGTLDWYDDAALTSYLGSGVSQAPNSSIGTTTYYVTETSLAGCTSSASQVTIVISARPTFTVGSVVNPSGCGLSDGSITVSGLSASTAYTLAYADDGTPVGPLVISTNASGEYVISGLNAGSYGTFAINDGTCPFGVLGPLTLTDPATPTAPVAGTNATYCSGQAMADLSATSGAGGTLNWFSDAALTNNIGTGTNLSPGTSLGSTTYYVTETVANCQSAATAVTIVINETPVVPIAGTNATYCDGDLMANMTAVASLGGTLNWYNDAALTNLVGTGVSVAPANTVGVVTYYVTETTLSGCVSSPSSVVITINARPTFTVGNLVNPSGCGFTNGSITISGLIASANYTLTYNDGGTPVGPINITADASGAYLISSLDAGSYASFVVDDGTCTFTVAGPFNLTDPNSPVFTLSSTNPTTCGGTEGTITISGLDPSTSYDISYNDGAGVVNATISTNGAGQIVLTGLGAGTYSGFVAVLSGCTGTNNGPVVLTDPLAPTAPVAGTNATYCSGQVMADLTATAGAGGALNWYSDAALTTNIGSGTTLAPGTALGATTYFVTETVSNCQSAASSVTITINETPTAPLAGTDATYCDGDVIANMTAAASLGGTLNWYDDAGLTNLVGTGGSIAPAGTIGTTTYYVTETATGCTSPASQVVITINPTPTFTVSASTNPSGCGFSDATITISGLGANQTVDLTINDGSGPVTGNITTDASGEYVITGLDAGNYTITVTLGSCSFSLAVPVSLTDPNAPVFTISSSNPTACAATDGSITLNGLDPNTTYDISYNDGSVVNLNGVTTDGAGSYVITGLDAGSYGSFVVELAGCSGSQAGPIVLSDPGSPAAPMAGTDAVYCDGDALADLTATAGSGGTLTWYEDAGLSISIGTGATLTPANTIGTTVYYVTETVAGCESPAATVTVEINTTPTSPLVLGDAIYCDGEVIADLTTSATSGGIIEWYDDATLTNLVATGNTVTPSGIVGTETWYVTEVLGGCSSATVTTVSVTVNPTPTFTVTANSDPSVCGGVDGTLTIGGLDPTMNYEVTYNDGVGIINLGTITTDASGIYIITGLGAGSYSDITVTLGNCDYVLPGGVISITDPGAPTFTVSTFSTTTCNGSDGGFTLAGLDPNTSYDVNYNDGTGIVTVTLMSDASGEISLGGLPAGTYTQISVELVGCTGSAAGSFIVTEPATPGAPTAGTDATYCEGDAMADMTATAGAGGTITWYADATLTTVLGTGATFSPLNVNGATSYYVTETSTGCESPVAMVTITITATSAAPTVSADASYCTTDVIADMTANPSAGGTIAWYSDAALTNQIGTGNALAPGTTIGATTYYVAEMVGACSGVSAQVTITLAQCAVIDLIIPTGFTPDDGNGENDFWEIPNLSVLYPNAVVQIYNRWGNRLYESAAGYPQPWDGSFNGEQLPVGSYYFVIDFKTDREPEKGTVTIIRK